MNCANCIWPDGKFWCVSVVETSKVGNVVGKWVIRYPSANHQQAQQPTSAVASAATMDAPLPMNVRDPFLVISASNGVRLYGIHRDAVRRLVRGDLIDAVDDFYSSFPTSTSTPLPILSTRLRGHVWSLCMLSRMFAL